MRGSELSPSSSFLAIASEPKPLSGKKMFVSSGADGILSSVENLSLALGVSTILKRPMEVLNINSYFFGTRFSTS